MGRQAALVKDVVAGVVVSLSGISFYISAAALLFQGTLAPHLSSAIGAGLLGAIVLTIAWALRGSIPIASVGPEPATVPVLAGMTAYIAAQCSEATAFPTAAVALMLASVLIGLAWYALGHFRAGDVIRFIPYPVVGGFLAAIGWLMLSGGLGVVLGQSFSFARLGAALVHGLSPTLLAGALVCGGLWWSSQRFKHFSVLPALLVAFSLLIHGWLVFQGIGLDQAQASGWLMPAFSHAVPDWPLAPSLLQQVNWSVLGHEAGVMLSATIVSLIALLLSDSSLEVAFDTQADLNRDLKVLGLGNVALGVMGGLVGGVSVSRSMLNREAGAQSPWAGVAMAMVCAVALVAGGPLISLVPKAVLGGLLMYLGLGMLKNWLVDGRKRLGRSDYLVVAAMVLATMTLGYLPAVVIGIVVCCFDFAISTARLGQIRRIFTRNEWPSKVERSAADNAVLQASSHLIQVVELQGALFFGSIRSLTQALEDMLARDASCDHLVLDFKRVHLLDSSAAQALTRLVKKAAKDRVAMSFSGVNTDVTQVLRANGCLAAGGPSLYKDIDHAIHEWEQGILTAAVKQADPLHTWLSAELGSAEAAQQFVSVMQAVPLRADQLLVSQGEPADALYLVQSGQLSATVTVGGISFRVRSIQAGGTVGEMGLYRQTLRSATVRAEMDSVVLCLSQDALLQLEREHPALAIRVHRLFVRLLASRLDHANAQTTALAA